MRWKDIITEGRDAPLNGDKAHENMSKSQIKIPRPLPVAAE
jgi:hypothetical protein